MACGQGHEATARGRSRSSSGCLMAQESSSRCLMAQFTGRAARGWARGGDDRSLEVGEGRGWSEFEKTANASVTATSLNPGAKEIREHIAAVRDRSDGHKPESIFQFSVQVGNCRNTNPRPLKRGHLCMRAWRVVFWGSPPFQGIWVGVLLKRFLSLVSQK